MFLEYHTAYINVGSLHMLYEFRIRDLFNCLFVVNQNDTSWDVPEADEQTIHAISSFVK